MSPSSRPRRLRRSFGLTVAVALSTASLATFSAPAAQSAGAKTSALRIAALGADSDTLDVRTATGGATYLTMFHLYDSLVVLKGDKAVNSLATSITPNADATVWTVKLQPRATFHDGKPVTGADVLDSFSRIADPKTSPNFSGFFTDFDFAKSKVIDAKTVQFALKRSRGDLVETTFTQVSFVFPAKSDFSKGIGSGPYKLASFEKGKVTKLTANTKYWGGVPKIKNLEIRPIADAAARLNALKAGQVDYASGLPPSAVATERSNTKISILSGGEANSSALIFAMNVKQKPFDDPRVVEAFKLVADREALNKVVLFGEGVVGNDVFGQGLPGFNTALPARKRDVAKAKQLLEAAGVKEVTLRAADVTPGIVAASELFAQQAAEAGVKVTIDKADPSTYFADFGKVLSTPFQGFYFINRPAAALIGSYTGSTSFFNVTSFGTPAYDAALAAAQETPDAKLRAERFNGLQKTLQDQDGLIVWGYAPQLDASVPGLSGVELSQSIPLFAKASRK